MARYRDPAAPAGRVVFGGTEFIDGLTADIEPGPATLELFKSAGIKPEDTTKEPEPDKKFEPPAPRKK